MNLMCWQRPLFTCLCSPSLSFFLSFGPLYSSLPFLSLHSSSFSPFPGYSSLPPFPLPVSALPRFPSFSPSPLRTHFLYHSFPLVIPLSSHSSAIPPSLIFTYLSSLVLLFFLRHFELSFFPTPSTLLLLFPLIPQPFPSPALSFTYLLSRSAPHSPSSPVQE